MPESYADFDFVLVELQEKGEFSMLELPARRPDAFTADDVAEVVQHFPAFSLVLTCLLLHVRGYDARTHQNRVLVSPFIAPRQGVG